MAISEKQLHEFKERVLAAKRPLFFYDDDADGLCSYLVCYRAKGSGTGIRVHGSATVTLEHARKVEENSPDLIIVLDKPYVEQAFIDAVSAPIIWLDHHEPQKPQGNITYLNPRIDDDKDNRSTTYWTYKAMGRKEDLWLAAIGNITDWQLTDVAEAFWTERPDILAKADDPPKLIYHEPFATLCKMIQFNLKGDATDVRTAIKIFSRVESPDELLAHTTPRAKLVYKRYQTVEKEYTKYLEQAAKAASDKELLFFLYHHMTTSLLSELSNQMLYEFPDKVVFLGREHAGEVKMSIRGSHHDIAAAVKLAMAASGAKGNAGGHTHACGGNIKADDFPAFLEALKKALALE